jgi:hypothetical protein
MKRFAEQLKKQSHTVKLRVSERRELRERLVAYMEYHPLPEARAIKVNSPMVSESFSIIKLNSFEVRSFFGALAVLLLIFVPVLAEKAVPGDVLYSFKVNVSEEIRSTLSGSPYAKVEWETKRLNRRIAEARLLASEGKLTEEAEADVVAAVKHHSDAAQESIYALRESDGEEAALAEIAFESALMVQAEVLEKELAKEVSANAGASSTPGRSVATLASAVAEAKTSAASNQSGVNPSYERLSVRMEQETTRAYELFESIKGVAHDSEVTNVERRLRDVERKLAEAFALHAQHADSNSEMAIARADRVLPEVVLMKTALSDLQKLIHFMTDIDVRESVTVDELVPVTLTKEEKLNEINRLLLEVESDLESLNLVIDSEQVSLESLEKVETNLIKVVELASSTKVALENENLAEAEASISEAVKLVSDIKNIIGHVGVSPDNTEEEVEEDNSTSTDEIIDETDKATTSEQELNGSSSSESL